MAHLRSSSYPCSIMTLNEGLTAAYQIPCCFSAALLVMASVRAALREFLDWFDNAGLES